MLFDSRAYFPQIDYWFTLAANELEAGDEQKVQAKFIRKASPNSGKDLGPKSGQSRHHLGQQLFGGDSIKLDQICYN